MKKYKIIRSATVGESLSILLKGQLNYLNQYFDVVGVSSPGEFLNQAAVQEGIKIHGIEMSRSISPLKDFKSLWQLYRFFKKEKPNLVHSITPKAGLLSMLAAKFAGVPVRLHTFTGLLFPYRTGLLQKILITTDKILCWAATDIFPEGKGVKQDLEKYKITKKKLTVLANGNVNGVDLAYFNLNQFSQEKVVDLKKSLGIRETDFVFIFVGRLVKDKGINELIKSFEKIDTHKLNSKTPKLLLVGPMESELDPLDAITLQSIEKNGNIISVGFQKDVRPYMAIADALVFPSYREGFPNVVLQAGAMELPSIVTNISGCNEIIIKGENGIIVPVKDVSSLISAMEQMILNVDEYHKHKSSSRNLIESRYSQQLVWSAVLTKYSELLN